MDKSIFFAECKISEDDLIEANITWDELMLIEEEYCQIERALREIGKSFIDEYLYDIETAGIHSYRYRTKGVMQLLEKVIRKKKESPEKFSQLDHTNYYKFVTPEGIVFHQGQIAEAVHFQEQYFDFTVDSLFRKSCGVLPYRDGKNRREYLIVYEHYSQCWSLPKGHMEAGETEVQTALRELCEETGLAAEIDSSVSAAIEYPISPISRKQVVFFPGHVSGTPRTREGEIEDYKWITAAELKDYLFPDTVEACLKIIEKIS